MEASIILLLVLCGPGTALIRQHFYFNTTLNWNDAQTYCRTYYESLSIITSHEDETLIFNLTTNQGLKWIGLSREMTSHSKWLWPNGESVSFSDWGQSQPDNAGENQYCVAIIYKWFDFSCLSLRPFFCSKTRYILVKENKTWEEALHYCKTNYNDLASMNTDRQLQLAKDVATGSQTDSVWTGQRYLVGRWLWTNNDSVQAQISLQECPAEPFRCGARNMITDTWENRDCTQRINFLCN